MVTKGIILVGLLGLALFYTVDTDPIQYTEADILTTPLNCTYDTDCSIYHAFAVCVKVNITYIADIVEEQRCVCDLTNGYRKSGNTCIYQALLGETCREGESICIAQYAHCKDDGDNMNTHRCLCKPGYTEVLQADDFVCGSVLTMDMDISCEVCENNGGICYDLNDDGGKDGCVCPTFTSGDDCSNVHVSVDCDVGSFTMRICYEPQTGFNFTSSAVMMVNGKGYDQACKGFAVETGDSDCSPDRYKLILPLGTDRDRCGTKMYMADVVTRKFENKLIIQKKFECHSKGDISFTTSCSFKTHADTSFQPIGQFVVNKYGTGEHHAPGIAVSVENHLGNFIPEGVALRLGDQIRLRIILTVDGTYAAIRVLRCTASTKPSMPDPSAFTKPLVVGSCPAESQSHIDQQNNWRPVSGRRYDLRTGLMAMFKMPQGRSVHIHCAIKLCLQGLETECDPEDCTHPASHLGYGRKKRSEIKQPAPYMISRELIWYEKESIDFQDADTGGNIHLVFPVMTGVLCACVVGIISVIVVLILRLRKRKTAYV